MRALFIADDQLVPVRDGGKLANVNDAGALVEAGYDVAVLVMALGPVSSAARQAHRDILGETYFVQQRPQLAANLRYPLWPGVVSRHSLGAGAAAAVLRDLGAAHGDIDLVVTANEYTLPFAHRVAAHFDAPLILRSQNDEVRYLLGMARAGSSVKDRLFYGVEGLRLAGSIRRLLRGVTAVALISEADRRAYEASGVLCGVVPPTLSRVVRRPVDVPGPSARARRVVFVGALGVPHTAAGVLWFAERVMPLLRRELPDTELDVIGRGAPRKLRAELEALAGVCFRGEVDDLDEVFDTARAFVNPVFHGSGVNMKLGPPAAAGLPIVATTLGVRGLDRLAGAVERADTAQEFSDRLVRLLTDGQMWQERSAAVRRCVDETYSPAAVAVSWRDLIAQTRQIFRPTT